MACFVDKNNITTVSKFQRDTSVKAVEKGEDSRQIRISGTQEISGNYSGGYYIYKEPYYIGNLGHLLGDDIWATFSMLFKFNLDNLNPSKLFILMETSNQGQMLGSQHAIEHYKLITPNEIIYIDPSVQKMCVENLLVGWNELTYSHNHRDLSLQQVTAFKKSSIKPEYTAKSAAWLQNGTTITVSFFDHSHSVLSLFPQVKAFRKRALKYIGKPDDRSTSCDVLFVLKDNAIADHKFWISNVPELMNALRTRSNCTITSMTLSGFTFSQQIEAFINKRIVVALPGSDIMNSIFQPINSGLICPYRCNDNKCGGSMEIALWYSRIPHRHFVNIPPNKSLKWNGSTLTWNVDHFVNQVLEMHERINSDIRRLHSNN